MVEVGCKVLFIAKTSTSMYDATGLKKVNISSRKTILKVFKDTSGICKLPSIIIVLERLFSIGYSI